MNAPTPDGDALVKRLKRSVYYGNMNATTMNLLSEAANALAAVTAELDQARQMLADAPHESGCGMTRLPGYLHSGECFCWKAGL